MIMCKFYAEDENDEKDNNEKEILMDIELLLFMQNHYPGFLKSYPDTCWVAELMKTIVPNQERFKKRKQVKIFQRGIFLLISFVSNL